MDIAEKALAQTQAARAEDMKMQIRTAAYHCIKNAEAINKILVAGTIEPTTHRVIDENKARLAIEQAAAALANNKIKVNVSTQNRLNAHIDHLTQQLTEMRDKYLQLQQENISLQSTLEAEVAARHKLLEAKLTVVEAEEELQLMDSFEYNLDRELFPTPKKKDGGLPMPKGSVAGKGNLFGSQELEHNKLKY